MGFFWNALSAVSMNTLMKDIPPTTPMTVPATANDQMAMMMSMIFPSVESGWTSVKGSGRPHSMEVT